MKAKKNILMGIGVRVGVLLSILIMSVLSFTIVAQDQDTTENGQQKVEPMLKLNVVKSTDGSRILEASLAYRDKETREFILVTNAELVFYTGFETPVRLGTAKTSENGKGQWILPHDYNYIRADGGLLVFKVEFEGNELLEASVAEVELVDVQVNLFLEVIDSIKTVRVEAFKILGDNKTEPLNEEQVQLCIGRMFSHLKVGDIDLTEGEGVFEFPEGLPGDSMGMLKVIAKFEEHETFGTVMAHQMIGWGVATDHHQVYHPRSLWTQVAPVWMIVTLSIMLLGVWGHYFYVIIQLVRLKKIKEENPEASAISS
jgi:hypothetical protein